MVRQSLSDDTFSRGLETAVQLLRNKNFSAKLAAEIRKEGGVKRAISALMREFELDTVNEFEIDFAIDLDEQLKRFADALPALRKVGFTFMGKSDEQILHELRETAPEWPKGKLCFRFIQIREGEGDEGVQKTFDLHEKAMVHTFTPKWWRWDAIKTDKNHLRLLEGNQTHTPCIRWVCADMDTHRKRDSITAVRSDDSLADELLAFSWQFPEYCNQIDYDNRPGLFAAGYELSVEGDEVWSYVPIVRLLLRASKVNLRANNRSNDYSYYSVPSLLRE